jgi:hypothetical protein
VAPQHDARGQTAEDLAKRFLEVIAPDATKKRWPFWPGDERGVPLAGTV